MDNSRSSAALATRPEPPLRSATKGEAVAQWLRERLAEGEWAPGATLPQLAIAARLGVSQTPVREAIRLLAAEGLVEVSAHLSAVVPRLDRAAVIELYAMREALEGLAVETAMRSMDEAARNALVRQMTEIQRQLEAAARDGGAAVPSLNQTFHFTLYAAAGMPRLMEAITRLWALMPAYWLRTIPGRATAQSDFHLPIMAAVGEGDAAGAAEAMRRHIRAASETLQTWLEQKESMKNETDRL